MLLVLMLSIISQTWKPSDKGYNNITKREKTHSVALDSSAPMDTQRDRGNEK